MELYLDSKVTGWQLIVYTERSQNKTRSSASAEIARNSDAEAHSLHLSTNLSPESYNLRPLNSPIRTTYISLAVPSLHIDTLPLSQVELKNTAGSRWTYFGVRVPRTLDYPTIKQFANESRAKN